MESAQYLFLLLIQNTSLFLIGSHPPPIYSFIYLGSPILGRVTTRIERAFSSSPLAATNETEKYRYIHLIPKIKKIKSPYFTSIAADGALILPHPTPFLPAVHLYNSIEKFRSLSFK